MSDDFYRTITACRICRSGNLEPILDLGMQSLASLFPRREQPDPEKAPLALVHCADCGLVQLRHSVMLNRLYTYGYGYRSGTNATMRGHLADLAAWVESRCKPQPGDLVVDIGCNDGTLLLSYATAGLRRVGIDPIVGKFKAHYPADITLHEGFFSAASYAAACGGEKAKAVTSISMFYDVESPPEFAAAIRSALAPDGIWVLEQSYLPTMLDMNAYDTICHEHLEYYALRQIELLAKAQGLRVFDVVLNWCNGGSFRLAVCHDDGPYADNEQALSQLRRREREMKLDESEPYRAFASRIAKLRSDLVAFVDKERGAGKRFYVYGASTKGNTLLQYCGLDATRIVAAAERNPEKYGCRTPGTGIPIISEMEARAAHPDYFLVLPWHFREEFVQREADFRSAGGKLIFPLPRLDVL
jgi:NDP-4-keto-2,6-dideoxyhexose 3-C-methyltransferase